MFDATDKVRLTMPDGKIVHAELQIGDSRVNLAEAMQGWPLQGLLAPSYVPHRGAPSIASGRRRSDGLSMSNSDDAGAFRGRPG